MAKIAGVDLPKDKRIEIGLTYIYGVGRSLSNQLLTRAEVSPDTQVKNLTEKEVQRIKDVMQDYKVEGDLRREVALNIKRLMDINTYRGLRHRKNLPVRGQRTKTNARTRKGPKKTVGVRKKETAPSGGAEKAKG